MAAGLNTSALHLPEFQLIIYMFPHKRGCSLMHIYFMRVSCMSSVTVIIMAAVIVFHGSLLCDYLLSLLINDKAYNHMRRGVTKPICSKVNSELSD